MLALLALAGAQVFGMQRGYLCECNGEAVETTHSHCHVAPTGEAQTCEDSSDSPSHSHHHEDSGSKQHVPLKVKLNAQGKVACAQAPMAPLALPLTAMPWLDLFSLLPGADAVVSRAMPLPPYQGGPPGVIQVAKCMVLLV